MDARVRLWVRVCVCRYKGASVSVRMRQCGIVFMGAGVDSWARGCISGCNVTFVGGRVHL